MTTKSPRVFRASALFVLLELNAQALAQDTNYWIFVCFGQSNMEEFQGAGGVFIRPK